MTQKTNFTTGNNNIKQIKISFLFTFNVGKVKFFSPEFYVKGLEKYQTLSLKVINILVKEFEIKWRGVMLTKDAISK